MAPAVDPGLGWEIYLQVLSSLAEKHRPNASRSVVAIERWLEGKAVRPGEEALKQFREDLKSKAFRKVDGSPYKSSARQLPTDLFTLHNMGVEVGEKGFSRKLFPATVFQKYQHFLSLTPLTQTALEWFQLNAPRKGSRKLMTGQMRRMATNAAIAFLDRNNVAGLELVENEAVSIPHPDHDHYKRIIRSHHTVSIVYTACCDEGLLPQNPLSDTPHESFHRDAEREFLAPDMIERIRDLDNLDWGVAEQVVDRLTVLLLLDLGLRKNELAGVLRKDVRSDTDGYFTIRLAGSVQKMSDKPTIDLPILYPETARLLSHYLRKRSGDCGGLILNKRGGPASGEVIASRVKREAERLDLVCQHSGKRPTCHALRRSFPTCNSAPLGLGLPPDEIAFRLRIDLNVAYEHYVLRNPLISAMRADSFRQKAKRNPRRQAKRALMELETLQLPAQLREQLDVWIDQAYPRPISKGSTESWIREDEVKAVLSKSWGRLPKWRNVVGHLKELGAVQSSPGKAALYNPSVIEELASCQLLDDLLGSDLNWRHRNRLTEGIHIRRLGHLRLVMPSDVTTVLRRRNASC